MRHFLSVVLAVVVMAAAGQAEAEMYKGYETAPYRVDRSIGEAEVRQYAPHLVAEVTVTGSRSDAAGKGFRVLAGYIFGGNEARAKIAMTTPVAQAPAGTKIAMTAPVTQLGTPQGWTIRFALPSEMTLATLPVPKDGSIRLIEAPARRMLVLRFSGWLTDASLAQEANRLTAIAAEAGLTVAGAPEYMFYDSPFTLPWNRRNEVALVLK